MPIVYLTHTEPELAERMVENWSEPALYASARGYELNAVNAARQATAARANGDEDRAEAYTSDAQWHLAMAADMRAIWQVKVQMTKKQAVKHAA